MTIRVSNCAGSATRNDYVYDYDGRVTEKKWPTDSTNTPAHQLTFTYGADASHAGANSVFKAVNVVNMSYPGWYNYYYDAFGRRRLKVYPNSISDEYFYDVGHQMLADRGNETPSWTFVAYPLDEYIWLDGRPVALVRSKFSVPPSVRAADLTGSCLRNGESTPCGIYFIVTDHIGKPVLLIDSNRKVAGAADYDPFGHPNRVAYHAATAQPYGPNTSQTLASLTQPLGPSASVQLRAHLHLIDTEADVLCMDEINDYAYLTDQLGNWLPPNERIGGQHQGSRFTQWVDVPSDGRVNVKFTSDAQNRCPPVPPDECVNCTCASCGAGCSTCNYPYTGVAMEGYEYRRFETGAYTLAGPPPWTPLRFPGQYYDPETDLFENWNRYYDPSIGRYLQPEPLLSQSVVRWVGVIRDGRSGLSTYSYARSNPLTFVDPDGNAPKCKGSYWGSKGHVKPTKGCTCFLRNVGSARSWCWSTPVFEQTDERCPELQDSRGCEGLCERLAKEGAELGRTGNGEPGGSWKEYECPSSPDAKNVLSEKCG